jgi:hypothetical protein
MAITRKKPYVSKGTLPRISKSKNMSIESIKKHYTHVLESVNKVYPHGLSKIQKEHLKDMFLKNPRVTSGEVLKEMGYLSGIGKGKAPSVKK